jgi:hypothetical protein
MSGGYTDSGKVWTQAKGGPPILKSCSVIVGLLVGSIVAAACNYFDSSGIAAAPVANRLHHDNDIQCEQGQDEWWVHR